MNSFSSFFLLFLFLYVLAYRIFYSEGGFFFFSEVFMYVILEFIKYEERLHVLK